MSLKTNTLTGRHKMPALMDAKSPHIAARACLLVSLREAPPAEVLILINDRRKKTCFKSRFFECGRRERIRTSDPLVPNQLRYQAALLADLCCSYYPIYQTAVHINLIFIRYFAWCEERDLNPHVRKNTNT